MRPKRRPRRPSSVYVVPKAVTVSAVSENKRSKEIICDAIINPIEMEILSQINYAKT